MTTLSHKICILDMDFRKNNPSIHKILSHKKERTQHWNFSLNLDKNKMTRRTLDPEKLVKIHIYNNLLAYYRETCLSIFVPKRQRIFVPLSHFDVRVIHSRSDGTHKIANIYGSRDALPIPLYIISGQMVFNQNHNFIHILICRLVWGYKAAYELIRGSATYAQQYYSLLSVIFYLVRHEVLLQPLTVRYPVIGVPFNAG